MGESFKDTACDAENDSFKGMSSIPIGFVNKGETAEDVMRN